MNLTIRSYLVNVLLLIAALLLSVAVGSVFIPPGTFARILLSSMRLSVGTIDQAETFTAIIFRIRLPHTILIMLAGASLGASGAVYQGVFRNPLADPYLIGVASGAGLGAVLAMSVDWPQELLGLYTVPAAAYLGALVTILLVYQLARVGKTLPTTSMILAGVAISSFASSLMSFLLLRSGERVHQALSWIMGGGVLAGWPPVLAVIPYMAVGFVVLVLSGHVLNVLQFGEEQAQQLGINSERAKLILILAASLTTAAAVAFSGLIGFVGLIVPHIYRLFYGSDYRRLVPLSLLGGGTALLLADLLARVVLAPQVLPVGIVTALAGAPFFLWVLRRSRNETT
ncbi:MAG: iron ABC transporter permease [Anaerolineales bacterium]|nr:iron ABC transporter permease [Anaerolineales bacterium]